MKSTLRYYVLLLILGCPIFTLGQGYLSISGKIIDQQTKQPIARAYVGILGKGTGTVTNDKGEFVFKTPRIVADSQLVVAVVGYRMFKQKTSMLATKGAVIELVAARPQVVDSNMVKTFDARGLVMGAIRNIRKTMPEQPYLLTGFYQETLRQDSSFVEIKEAVLQAEKDPRPKTLLPEKIKLVRGRMLASDNRSKTLEGYAFPNGASIVTHSIDVGIPDYLDGNRLFDYNYQLDDTIAYYLDKSVYRVRFWPTNASIRAARMGIMTINSADSAIVAIEYEFTPNGLKDLLKTGAMDKVFGKTKREPQRFGSKVHYKPFAGKWYLQDYQINMTTQFEQKKTQFLGNITVHFATTEISKSNGSKIAETDLLLDTDGFPLHTAPKYDEIIWGNFNFMLPTASMRYILQSLSK